jgi:hypothetical protein
MAAPRYTRQQIAEAVETARELLVEHVAKGRIKHALRGKLGDVSARYLETIISRAREQLLREASHGKAYLKALSLAAYQRIIGDPDTSTRERIRALARVDKLMGLEDRLNGLPPLETVLAFFPEPLATQVRDAIRSHLRAPAPSGNGQG